MPSELAIEADGLRNSYGAAGSSLLGLAVGLALADSSIVTLALPEVLREFDVGVTTVAWVLTSFNLVLALVALPAAYVARRRARGAFVGGTVVFAAASVVCGAAPAFEALVAARCVQAIGAALVVTAAFALLRESTGSDARAAHIWVTAGVLGAALGPAAGGVLTELAGWESIFLAQVPLALVPLVAVRGLPGRPLGARARRPHLTANAALLLLSGGLVGALFLLVLLLVEGWGMSPAAAGLVATTMPLAAVTSGRLVRGTSNARLRIAIGIVLVAGGLAALAFLPYAGWPWTIPPQLLVGAGIGASLGALTETALAGREDKVVHGGWALAARHAGVVLGLLLLSPVLTEALERNRDDAVRAGTAVVLDSRVEALDKLGLAQDVLAEVDEAERTGELPRVEAVFEDRSDDEAHRELASALQDQLDRAVTAAFARPFLLAVALALAALLPVALLRGAPAYRSPRPLLLASAAVAAVLVPYLALGGASYEPTPVADPCVTREWRDPGDLEAVLEQVVLSALDGAACELGVAREDIVLAVRDEESLEAFAEEHGISREEAERAVADGVERAVDEAEAAGGLSGTIGELVARAVEAVPPWLLLDALERLRGLF
jgi:predicted MFS family arabinose efflux permease